MSSDKPNQTKRVSFAPEHQITYIITEDHSSTKTSSSTFETPMDLTTELAEFKNLRLFQKKDDSLHNENVDDIFNKDNIEEFQEDPILIKQYEKRFNKKLSLDPLRDRSFDNLDDKPKRRDTLNSNPDISSDNIFNSSGLNSTINLNKQNSTINFPSENKNNLSSNRKSIDGSFNDTNFSDNSYSVHELVNTMDLRKIVPQEKKEKREINEFLSMLGIRFLDESITEGIRRDTLSKSRNYVDPSLVLYYRNSVKERIDYLYNFSTFLSEKMKELQRQIDEVEQTIDCESLNKDLLKKLRNESRNKAKIDWYSLRKMQELQFNKIIMENKSKMNVNLNYIQKENDKCDEIIKQKKNSISELQNKIDEINSRLEKSHSKGFVDAEKLQQMIVDRKSVLESAKQELIKVKRENEEILINENLIKKSVSKLKNENEILKKNLLFKNITEAQLNDIKNEFNRYKLIYGFKILKMDKTFISVDILGNVVNIYLNSNIGIDKYKIENKENDPFIELVKASCINLDTTKLIKFLHEIVHRFVFVNALKKEVSIIREKHRMECFCVNEQLYLRIFVDSKRHIDFTVDSKFDLYYFENKQANLLEDLGCITNLTENELNK